MYRPSGLKYFLYPLTVKRQTYRLLHPACIVLAGLLLMISEFKLSLSMTCIALPRSRSGYNNVVQKWSQPHSFHTVVRTWCTTTAVNVHVLFVIFKQGRLQHWPKEGHCLLKRSLIVQKRTRSNYRCLEITVQYITVIIKTSFGDRSGPLASSTLPGTFQSSTIE